MPDSNLQLKPAIITIFGITGDLAKRKLLPALYHLAQNKILPKNSKIVGVTRTGTTISDVLHNIKNSVESDGQTTCQKDVMQWIESVLSIECIDLTKDSEYLKLKNTLNNIENKEGTCLLRIFYLAIPSTMFKPVVDKLGSQGLSKSCQHGTAESRLLIEKPFGYDLQSAKDLIACLQKSFTEDQIYRIDHYLAKETVQNILTLRFNNPIFANAWDNKHISHIMITASESIGIENRITFYEKMGAMRDFLQSHLLQLVSLVIMNEPKTMSAKDIHKQKELALSEIMPPKNDEMHTHTVRGQYKTYGQEVGNLNSNTETYASVNLSVKNSRWQGVPILIRTGKALQEKVNEITIIYQTPNKPKFKNTLTIRIQPNQGIVLDLSIKKPGFEQKLEHVQMDFCYQEKLTDQQYSAYERVLVDALRGDKTLFVTSKEVLESWRIANPILEAWDTGRVPLEIYNNDTWGPISADVMAKEAGTTWLTDILHICTFHFPNK